FMEPQIGLRPKPDALSGAGVPGTGTSRAPVGPRAGRPKEEMMSTDLLDVRPPRVRRSPRPILLLALFLLATTAGVLWAVPLVVTVPSLPVLALLEASLVTALCFPFLSYVTSRGAGAGRRPDLGRAEGIVSHAPEGILLINKYGQVLSLNPAA